MTAMLAAAMLVACPLGCRARGRPVEWRVDPWGPAGEWIWVLPAALAVLDRVS